MVFFKWMRSSLMDAAGADGAAAGGGAPSTSGADFGSILESAALDPTSDSSGSDGLGDLGTDGRESMVNQDNLADEPEPVAEKEPVAEEEQPVEEPVAQPEKPEGEEEEWDLEVGAPKVITRDGKKLWVYSEARGRTLHSGYKLAKEYQSIAPSLDEARTHLTGYIGHENLKTDFASGDPASVSKVLGFLNSTSPAGMEAAAEVLARELPKGNPQAYAKLRGGMIQNLAEEFYSAYSEIGNAEDDQAKRFLFAAQCLDAISGKAFRNPKDIKAPDPVATRLQEIQEREAKLRQAEQQRSQNEVKSWSEMTNTHIRSEINGLYKTALAPIQALEKANPKAYNRALLELRTGVQDGVNGDKLWQERWNVRYRQALQSRNDDDRKALTDMYVAKVRTIANRIVAPIVKDYTETFKVSAEKRQARANDASQRKDLPGGAAGSKPLMKANARYDDAKKTRNVNSMVDALVGL
jgi:hypothetical protein